MKTKLISIHIIVFFVLISCKKDGQKITIEDHYLNYEIPEIPVTENYNVGVFYSKFTSFSTAIKEIPVLGKYAMNNTTGVPPAIMDAHIDYAVKGGIDFFIFQVRSFNRNLTNAKIDTNYLRSFLNRNTEGKVKYAINLDLLSNYSISSTNLLEKDPNKIVQLCNDFERMEPYFNDANYMKIEGKPLVYLNGSNNLYSADNKAIYAEIRRKMLDLGIELYIVGHQESWSAPAKYAPYRFAGCVDAVYQSAFFLNSSTQYPWDLFYLLPQAMDQNFKYNREYMASHYNLDFIPNIFPANDFTISTPTTSYPSVKRNDGGALYKKICNVAKMNANSKTRLVMIDSFNSWTTGTQLEPAESYGELYLNITRQQFKK